MKRVYYAHPISMYGTALESMDICMLELLGFEVVNPNMSELDSAYQLEGMAAFTRVIQTCDVLAFRSFRDGKISAGVGVEIQVAYDNYIQVFEIPQAYTPRVLSIEETRERLRTEEARKRWNPIE